MSPDGMPTADFSSVAERYDDTRDMPAALLGEFFARAAAVGFVAPRDVLDAGCGTGQVSLPLAQAGHRVVGLDVSAAMLARARGKLRPARLVLGDVRAAGFRDASFDATVVSKLFQHVPGWRDAVEEIRRVTKPGGHLLHVNETGAFQNAVRRRFAQECDRRGHTGRYRGLRDRSELAGYVQHLGGRPLILDVQDLSWEKDITYGAAFDHLRQRLHAEFWSVPDADHAAALDAVAAWIADRPRGSDTVEHMTPHLTAEVFRWERT